MRAFLIAVLLALTATAVHAQGNAAAEIAFARGRQLMKEGNYAEACNAFEQSLRIDPQMGTRYNLALCWEHQGRLASAWAAFREVAQRDTRVERKEAAKERARALEPRLTRLVVSADEPAPGISILLDERDVTAQLGVESPVDPGTHRLVARAPGFREWSTDVSTGNDAQVVRVTIGRLEPLPPPPVRATAAPPVRSGDGTRRRAGIATVAGGGAAVVVGLSFGYLAWRKWDGVEDLCGADRRCPSADLPAGQELAAAARFRGNVATAFTAAGAVAIGVGAYLWLSTPEPEGERAVKLSPVVQRRTVGLSLEGSF